MMSVGQHMESMECYACHADWAPQCYGCHITVDYSEGKTDVDWIENANSREDNGLTADNALGTNGLTSEGKVSETRSYLRWETPTLGINGEGRVSPMMPGCQVITTVIDKDGNTVVHNETWMTPEGKGLDHAAVQPHTAGREARSCESCHNNPKSLGYGIEGGRFLQGYEVRRHIDRSPRFQGRFQVLEVRQKIVGALIALIRVLGKSLLDYERKCPGHILSQGRHRLRVFADDGIDHRLIVSPLKG